MLGYVWEIHSYADVALELCDYWQCNTQVTMYWTVQCFLLDSQCSARLLAFRDVCIE